MKKYGLLLLLVVISFFGKNVFAEEIYYTNSSGVAFTKEEYDFYTDLAYDGYQERVTEEMLNEIKGKDRDSLKMNVVKMCLKDKNDGIMTAQNDDNLFIETTAKSLSMGKYCTPFFCRVVAVLKWLVEPAVKSYDAMGAFIDGPTRLTDPVTTISTGQGAYDPELVRYQDDGFGAIFKLPEETNENTIIDQSFMFEGSGMIFMTYQHTMYNLTLNEASQFDIDFSGFGNVFDFYGEAFNAYDNLPGVYMYV